MLACFRSKLESIINLLILLTLLCWYGNGAVKKNKTDSYLWLFRFLLEAVEGALWKDKIASTSTHFHFLKS